MLKCCCDASRLVKLVVYSLAPSANRSSPMIPENKIVETFHLQVNYVITRTMMIVRYGDDDGDDGR
jgi:hypothetical protein